MRTFALASLSFALAVGCWREVEHAPDPSEFKTSSLVRAQRRAYDGSPPVIPHDSLGASCTACHTKGGLVVRDLGVAPASPHVATPGMANSRCEQCHVYQETYRLWVVNGFQGKPQELGAGDRSHPGAPPVLPHPVFMREDCLSCHDGGAAREEIRTSHPERTRCLQCHAEQRIASKFQPGQ